MQNVEVISCGTKCKHKKGFKYSQSSSKDCYLLLVFETSFISYTKDGIREGEAYSYILHPPQCKIFHTDTPDSKTGFTNDWMYLKGEYVDFLTEKFQIQTNVIIPTFGTKKISDIISQIQKELLGNDSFKEDYIKSLVTTLFIELARSDQIVLLNQDKDAYSNINGVKKTMLKNFKNRWTLSELAALSSFSQSHFLTLYKQLYGKSPIDDLIDHRIDQAKIMLEGNMMNINEIATECGFNTPYYFSRTFKKRTGLSPSQYQAEFFKKIGI